MVWFLYDNGLRLKRVKADSPRSHSLQLNRASMTTSAVPKLLSKRS